jgi:hypothetical protein
VRQDPPRPPPAVQGEVVLAVGGKRRGRSFTWKARSTQVGLLYPLPVFKAALTLKKGSPARCWN